MTPSFTAGHALLIGVGADLPFTVDDALGLAGILQDNGRCAYPPTQVHPLTGPDASRTAILAALDKLAQTTDETSTVIIYFSGHGYEVATTTGMAYYLMPYGYDKEALFKTAVSGAELAAKLRAIPAQKLLLLLDCCHAGGLDETKAPGVTLTKAPLPPEAPALLAEGRGRVIIASSRADEKSLAGKPYSAFTLALVEALAGQGVAQQDGYVRVADLAGYAREMVPRRTKDRQHPILNFEQADNFILAYYAGGEKSPKPLPFSVEPVIEDEPGALNRAAAPSYWAKVEGGGAIAQGPGATAVGERGVNVGGNVSGSIVTGDNVRVDDEGRGG